MCFCYLHLVTIALDHIKLYQLNKTTWSYEDDVTNMFQLSPKWINVNESSTVDNW